MWLRDRLGACTQYQNFKYKNYRIVDTKNTCVLKVCVALCSWKWMTNAAVGYALHSLHLLFPFFSSSFLFLLIPKRTTTEIVCVSFTGA